MLRAATAFAILALFLLFTAATVRAQDEGITSVWYVGEASDPTPGSGTIVWRPPHQSHPTQEPLDLIVTVLAFLANPLVLAITITSVMALAMVRRMRLGGGDRS